MKKSLILSIIMLILLAVIFYKGMKDGQNAKGNKPTGDRAFAVEEIDEIYGMRITQKKLPVIDLRKENGQWRVNNKYDADENTVFNLLEVCSRSRMDFIPSKTAYSNILNEMDRIGIKVEVFGKDNQKLKGYIIGGNAPQEVASYFMMEGSKQPYAVVVPGLQGAVRNRFQLTELKVRDKIIFKDMADQITEIKMEYLKDKSRGFSLSKSAKSYELNSIHPSTKIIDKPVNVKLAETYFKEFDKIASEWIENDNPRRDSINTMIPFCKLTLILKDGGEQSLSLFPMNDVIDPNVITVDLDNLQKVERYFGESSWGDFYLIQHRLIKGILRPYEYFFKGT